VEVRQDFTGEISRARHRLIPVEEALGFSVLESAASRIEDDAVRELTAAAERRVNVSEGPLIVVEVHPEPGGAVLIFGLCHTTIDGTGLSTLLEEVAALLSYQELPPAPSYHERLRQSPTTIDVVDPAWLRRLSRARPITWPEKTDPDDGSFAFLPITITADRMAVLRDRSRRLGVTRFVVVLDTFARVVHDVLAQDFRLGVCLSGRTQATIRSLGNHVRALPIPVDDECVQEGIDGVLSSLSSLRAYSDVPHQDLEQACVRLSGSQQPLFQVLIVWQNFPPWNLRVPGVEVESVALFPLQAMFDVTLELFPNDHGAQGWLEWDPRVVPADVAAKLHADLEAALQYGACGGGVDQPRPDLVPVVSRGSAT